jgi:signal transduction histidine kinase
VKEDGEAFIFKNLNKAALQIEKVNKADVLGKDLKVYYPTVGESDLTKVMKQVWETGLPHYLDPFYYEDSRIKGWRNNYYIFKLSPEEIVVVYDDISERMEQERIISENNRIIRETLQMDKLKNDFFANISHELRTPLNIILGAIQITEMKLQDKGIPIDRNKLLKNIKLEKQNCFRLIRLIENLIDTSILNSQTLKLNMRNCNIVYLVEEITESVAEYIQNHNLAFIFDTDIEERIIACDIDKIERIMLNLLSNSVKFTGPGGSIFVTVMNGNEYITITVEDTGIGIPESSLGLIFDRFTQVDNSFTRNYEGSGIGLSLVKAMVELHGGTISVESVYGEGSKFIIELPVKTLDHNEVEQEAMLSNNKMHQHVERIRIEFSDIYNLESTS